MREARNIVWNGLNFQIEIQSLDHATHSQFTRMPGYVQDMLNNAQKGIRDGEYPPHEEDPGPPRHIEAASYD